MSTLTGKTIAATYQQLLQVNSSVGVSTTLATVQDGTGNNSALQLSNSTVNINGLFQLNGNTLTATASALNAITDLSGVTGLVAMNGGVPLGRSIVAGTGLSVTNADGTAGNPTLQLDTTPVVSGSYGPVVFFDVNDKGQLVSASTPVSVSLATVRATEMVTNIFTVTSDVSIKGDVVVSGTLKVIGNVSTNRLYSTSIEATALIADVITVSTLNYAIVSVSAFTINKLTVVSAVNGKDATFTGNVSAVAFYGDGSGLTNLPTAPTSVSAFTVNQLTIVSTVSGVSGVFTGIVSANELVAPNGSFNTKVSTNALNVNGVVSATSAVFSGSVSALAFYGDGSGLTNLPAAPTSVSAFTVNQLTIVSTVSGVSGVFTGTVSANEFDAPTGSFSTNVSAASLTVSGVVSGNSAVFSGIVSANELVAPNGSFNTKVSTNALNVNGVVSATSGIFTGTVSANELVAPTGSFSTNVSAASLTVSGVVSGNSAVFSGIVSANELVAPNGSFSTKVSTNALNVNGVVSATSGIFTGTVSANEFDAPTGSFSTNVSTASLTVSGVVSGNSAVFSGIVSANELVAPNGSFSTKVSTNALNVNGVVSATSGVFTGTVSANELYAPTGSFSTIVSTVNLRVDGVVSVSGAAVLAGTVSAASIFSTGIALGTTALLGKKVNVSGAAVAGLVSLTDATSIAIDFNTSQNFIVQLGGNRTLETPSNCVAGQTGSIVIIQDGTGGRTLSYSSVWKWPGGTAPTLTTTSAAVDRIDYIVYTSAAVQALATLNIK